NRSASRRAALLDGEANPRPTTRSCATTSMPGSPLRHRSCRTPTAVARRRCEVAAFLHVPRPCEDRTTRHEGALNHAAFDLAVLAHGLDSTDDAALCRRRSFDSS